MSIFSRALLVTGRKPLKTLLVTLIVTIMMTTVVSAHAITNASNQAGKKAGKGLLSSFVLENNRANNPGTPRGGGVVKRADIAKISQLEGVTNYFTRIDTVADIKSGKPVSVPADAQFFAGEKERQCGSAVMLSGASDSALATPLRTGTLKLSSGRHLKNKDAGKALVHEELARANGWKLGSKITLSTNPFDADNEGKPQSEIDVEVVGTLAGKPAEQPQNRLLYAGNTIYTDLGSAAKLAGASLDTANYVDATFFTKGDPAPVMDAAKKLDVDWNMFQLTASANVFTGISQAVDGLHSLTGTVLWSGIGFAVILLILVSLLWVSERRRESAIYMSLGDSKLKILGQYVLECVYVLVPAGLLTWLVSGPVAQWMGTKALGRVQSQLGELDTPGAQLGGGLEVADVTRTIDHLNVSVTGSSLGFGILTGCVVAVLAVGVAAAFQLRTSPKALFANR